MMYQCDPYHCTRADLVAIGIKLSMEFLLLNRLAVPEFREDPRCNVFRGGPGAKGFYRPTVVSYCSVNHSLPVKVPVRAWSFPGYKADVTPVGVIAHEVGHHVDHLTDLRKKFKTEWESVVQQEPAVTSYEPHPGEAFAEALRLFITNPHLLRLGRPKRYAFITHTLQLMPLHDEPWHVVLFHAHERFHEVARKWISSGQSAALEVTP